MIKNLSIKFGINPKSFVLAVIQMDYLCMNTDVPSVELPLIAVICLGLAAKLHEKQSKEIYLEDMSNSIGL